MPEEKFRNYTTYYKFLGLDAGRKEHIDCTGCVYGDCGTEFFDFGIVMEKLIKYFPRLEKFGIIKTSTEQLWLDD